jgi:hypothetical protein
LRLFERRFGIYLFCVFDEERGQLEKRKWRSSGRAGVTGGNMEYLKEGETK